MDVFNSFGIRIRKKRRASHRKGVFSGPRRHLPVGLHIDRAGIQSLTAFTDVSGDFLGWRLSATRARMMRMAGRLLSVDRFLKLQSHLLHRNLTGAITIPGD